MLYIMRDFYPDTKFSCPDCWSMNYTATTTTREAIPGAPTPGLPVPDYNPGGGRLTPLSAGSPFEVFCFLRSYYNRQERPAVADKPARHLRNICTVYLRAMGL